MDDDDAPRPLAASAALHERAKAVMPGGNTRTTVHLSPHPTYLAHGAGARVRDVDGNDYLDCINNFTALIHGHAHPATMAAVRDQLSHGVSFGAPTPWEIPLAALLASRLPGAARIRFVNSGTEAVMMAIKAARAFTGRPAILKIEGAYHGAYDPAEASLEIPSPDAPMAAYPYARGAPESMLRDVHVAPFNDPAAIARILGAHGGAIAAVLIDPMPNRAGLIPASPDFLDAVFEGARKAGALVIFDEVISFRLGAAGAQGLWGARPDLTALGKIMGGGFPVGAVAGREAVMSVFDPTGGAPALPHGGTFNANPVTMRAGLATMEALEQEDFARLDALGDRLRAGVGEALARHALPGRCVGRASLFKIHFTEAEITDYRSVRPDARAKARLAALHRGLMTRGVLAAGYGLFALSTPMGEPEAEELLAALDGALSELAAIR